MKYWIRFSITCLITAYFIIGYIAYALFWPVGTLRIKSSQPIALAQTVVHPGDYLQYTLDYCKDFDGYPTVHRSLVDGQVITLTDSQGRLPTGCHTTIVKTALIPDTINPGRYYLSVDNEYQINPFHIIHVKYRTAYFDVVEGSSTPTNPGVVIIHSEMK